MSEISLENESERETELLEGKIVSRVIRNRETEVLILFTDGTRLFIDKSEAGLELSVTGGANE